MRELLSSAVMPVARYVARELLETFPSDHREAGVFLAGMVWAFALFWVVLIIVTYLSVRSSGVL